MSVDKQLNDMVNQLDYAALVKNERRLKGVLEMFLSWTGALAISGNITRDAWCELVDIRAKAERVLGDD